MDSASPPYQPASFDKAGIVIIGTGAVGSSLATALSKCGFPIVGIMSRTLNRAQDLALRVESPLALTFSDQLPTNTQVVFLCVPDDVITSTAQQLIGALNWNDTIVAHTSGAKAASALRPLADQGAAIMSFHPMQTFTRAATASFSDIYIGIEGESRAVQEGIKISRLLGAKHLVIKTPDKPRYHLAASIASNFMVTLMSVSCDVLESIGINRNEAVALLKPLVTQTCTNVTSNLPEQVLTGPAVRGDKKTLEMHLGALQQHLPHLDPFYRTLLDKTLAVALNSGRLDDEVIEEIKRDWPE